MGKENRDYNINPGTEQNRPASFVSSHGISPAVDVKPIAVLQKNNHLRRASLQVQEARNLVLRASQEGYLDRLTRTQRPVIEERYLREEGIIVSFKLVQERLGTDVTRSALHLAHRNGIERLERVKKGQPPVKKRVRPELAIDITQAKALFEAGYTRKEVAEELGCSKTILDSRNREHGIILKKGRPRVTTVPEYTDSEFTYGVNKDGSPRKKMGRPIKYVPGANPENLKILYWEKGLSLRKISQLLGNLSGRTIWERFVSFGIERRPRGRPRET